MSESTPGGAARHVDAPKISCIVPAFNESENLKTLLPSLAVVLATLTSVWEVIVVDDGSADTTPDLMQSWTQQPGYRYIQFSRNFGKEAALSAGLEAALGDVVICLDADLQHPPSLIPDMLAQWRTGFDTVIAVRANRKDESPLKRLGSSLLYFILGHASRLSIPQDAGDFRLMDRRVVNALIKLPERTRFMKGLYAWVGFKSASIPYQPPERLHGASHFNFMKLLHFAIDGITAFSTWPLRALSVVGALVSLLAFAYGGYLIVEYLEQGNGVSGWTTIVTAMLFLSGVNLLGLGVIGAYIGRIFDEVKQRPLYLVREESGQGIHRAGKTEVGP
jgi:glycosyltransferase involved in cell wall biosynthesis